MNYPAVLLVSVALGIDAFSVAISIGLSGVRMREIILVSGVVSIFHVFMPLIGLYLGSYLGSVAGPIASTVGALVLLAIGLNTIWESLKGLGIINSFSLKEHGGSNAIINIKNPVSLMLMAGSVSLDALTVGFGLGALQVDLFLTVITMGIVAGLMTAMGMIFGKGLNMAVGEKAEILGGLILVIIGLKLLV
jgi:putative Mn2+ efflux pump MntP